MTRCC